MPEIIKGKLDFYTETGTEGGYWAFQDEKFITPNENIPGGYSWSYDGLHILQNGDFLKIINPDGSIYWEGTIKLKKHSPFTENAFGFWIHSDQKGISREKWALPFFKGYNGILTKE